MREIKTQEPCSCVLFIKNTLIIGCDKFFQIDTTTFKMNGKLNFLLIFESN